MSDKKTKQEKKEARQERRIQRRRKDIERHTVACPHCSKPVLDHMTKCPHCGGALDPAGYRPPDPNKMRLAKTVCYSVLILAAVAVVIMIFLFKK